MTDFIQHILAHMTEGGMTQVMPQGYGFRQILIEIKGTAYGTSYLSHLKSVGKPGYIVIPQRSNENLRLMLEAPKSLRMDNTVPVALEGRTYRAGLFRFEPAPR
jgi:hypothetical protein